MARSLWPARLRRTGPVFQRENHESLTLSMMLSKL